MKLKFYTDPGHSWIAVKKDLLVKLGIANRITAYSYMKGKTAYLEEDCDASLLLDVLKDSGVKVELVRKHVEFRSPIRNYKSYSLVDR